MRDRHFRRRQRARARHRAVRFLKDICKDRPVWERNIYLYTQHRKPCSCYWCSGNKRREHKWERRITKEELRKDIEKEDIICPKKKYDW